MRTPSPQQLNRLQQMFASARQQHQIGKLTQAERLYRDILGQMPQQADTLNALGMLLHQQGRLEEAVETFRKAARADREAAYIQLNLGEALRAIGQYKEAASALKRGLQIRPNYPEAQFCLGSLLHDQHQQEKAIPHYRRAIQAMPQLAPAHNALGVALQELGRLEEARDVLLAAIRLQPDYAEAHLNLGNTLYKLEDFTLAEKAYRTCLQLNPNIAQAHLALAQLLISETIYDDKEVEQLITYAVEKLPEAAEAICTLGKLKSLQGNHDEARLLFKRSIEMEPLAPAIFNYADSQRFKEEDNLVIKAGQKLLDQKNALPPEAQGLIHFALGKMYDDLKQYDAAFKHYQQGNDNIHKIVNYDRAHEEDQVKRLIKFFTREFFDRHAGDGDPSTQPVFIVGMPRSGTTLTEQVLSSHPNVFGAGELDSMGIVARALPSILSDDRPYPELLEGATSSVIQKIAAVYLRELNLRFPGNYSRITEKLPHDFLRLGLIALMLPNAKIIHVARDPMDNCLSLYFQKFVKNKGHAYAYDLGDLGHQYLLYQKLMTHWHAVLPGRIFDLQYEGLIADPEYWSRKLIEFVGLEWDDACLAPHKQERTVKTASHWQVRQPIYKTSVQRWKHYEKHLGPLKDALGLG